MFENSVTNLLPTHTFISSFPPPLIGRGEEERQASEKRRREITPTRLGLLSEVLIRGSTSSAELSELVTRAHSLDGCELRRHVLRTCESCHKQYYQVYGPQDYQFDYPGASDPREESSIVVNMTRLQMLIDKALEEMEFRT